MANKGRKPFNGDRLTDVWSFNKISPDKLVHQNQKPVDLIKRCIIKHSNQGGLIFDGFMGSGTTAIAAMDTDRDFLGCEIDPQYFEIAQSRISSNKTQMSLFDEV